MACSSWYLSQQHKEINTEIDIREHVAPVKNLSMLGFFMFIFVVVYFVVYLFLEEFRAFN